MTPELFPQLLGLTNTDPALHEAVAPHAQGDTALAPARIQKLKSDFLMLTSLGVVFSFSNRETFQREFGAPRGEGPKVLSGIFYYPQGSEEVEPFEGAGPLTDAPVEIRQEALAAYGEPEASDGEDGAIEWEQWLVQGVELSADYDDEGEVLCLTAALPIG
ncbi:hypothetical protein OU995_17715 [Roseateles sp. SL47]|uniref:hypothetical protein n=1 Tax=Roseateles sp. SL47 TaxID=2995138 RepID=UPI0022713CB4|nr:hypothetical protein [Roseateles sp. SL47]WAC71413.1 hypothetical protein OU995_17715 [Roseateles sp. SL47]